MAAGEGLGSVTERRAGGMYGDLRVVPYSSSAMATGGESGGGGALGGHGAVSMAMGGALGGVNNMMMLSSGASSSSSHAAPDQYFPNHYLSGFMSSLPPTDTFSLTLQRQNEGATFMMGAGPSSSKDDEIESAYGSAPTGGDRFGEDNDDELTMFTHPPLGLSSPPKRKEKQQQQNPEQQNKKQKQQTNVNQGKKHYHRHTTQQIQQMEAVFKECPHPDDKQRLKLSQELGLKPLQIKFWFQNRRTHVKAQQDKADNAMLRAENDSLRSENSRLQCALRNAACPNCGGPIVLREATPEERRLRCENSRLKEEMGRISCFVATCGIQPADQPLMAPDPSGRLLQPALSLNLDVGVYARPHFVEPTTIGMQEGAYVDGVAPLVPSSTLLPIDPPVIHPVNLPIGGMAIMEQDKAMVVGLALTAAEQLVRLCQEKEPLWTRGPAGACYGEGEVMNVDEYRRAFPWPMDRKLRQHKHCDRELRIEASRGTAVVIMNSINLVDAFFDDNKWAELFPSIVSNARTIQVITSGIHNHGSGCLHLMYAELQFPSPLVPVREAYFFRYCQQQNAEGTWTVVDFPVDGFHGRFPAVPFGNYRRRPSGCLVQEMPNGYSMVTWVELAEVEDEPVHQMFDQFVRSGMAFGALRWLSVLQLQCERLASLTATNTSDLGVIPTGEGRKSMMNLSQRMVRAFFSDIRSSAETSWTTPLADSAQDTVRITTRRSTDQAGRPTGVVLCAVATTWLPCSHEQVFELLADGHRRSQLYVISGGKSLQEVVHIPIGSHQRNCVSLLRVNAPINFSPKLEMTLQESSTHPNGGSVVVYAAMDVNSVRLAIRAGDTSRVPLLPSGFIILPAPAPPNVVIGSDGDNEAQTPSFGCLLTVGLQVLASTTPSANVSLVSINAINNHIRNAVHQMGANLLSVSGGGQGGEGAAAHSESATEVAAVAPTADE